MKKNEILFFEYYKNWLEMYKEGAIREVTMKKYKMTLYWLEKIAPELKVKNLDRAEYQKIINTYAKEHEKQTTMDFHRQVKAAIIDALDDGLIKKDPTRRVIIKGKMPRKKKDKFLSLTELQKLVENLNLESELNYDWLIYLIIKTGLRFSEAIALTPKDFDFKKNTLNINKTWNYKENSGFDLTKNDSSMRVISIDEKTSKDFKKLCKNLDDEKPLFANMGKTNKIYNSTVNDVLDKCCKKAGITNITLHGLRHTHASVLLYSGVSVSSVSQRLGHSNMATTQKVYLHIIQELANKDKNIMMESLNKI